MPIEAFQARVAPATQIALTGTRIRSSPRTGGRVLSRSQSGYGRGTVYINEEHPNGRNIILNVSQDLRRRATPVARNRANPVAVRITWWCREHNDNLAESQIDDAYTARVPGQIRRINPPTRGAQEYAVREQRGGFRYQFTTSGCGLDRFIVTFQMQRGTVYYEDTVELTVRRRIRYHYVEMQTPNGQGAYRMRRTLARARTYLADNFGIDLVPIEPQPLSVPYRANPTDAELQAHLVQHLNVINNWNNVGPRDLYIVAVDNLSGNPAGRGGANIAAVAGGGLMARFNNFRNGQTQFRQGGGTLDDFLDHNNLQGDERRFYRWLFRGGRQRAREAVQLQVFTTMIHEIGHCFGLVPTNEQAAGRGQAPWRDAAHGQHCAKRSCAMFWEADLLQASPYRPLRSEIGKWFNHYARITEHPSDCALYALTADLHDIRHYP